MDDALIGYLKDGGAPDDPSRKEWAALLREQPEAAAALFTRAVIVSVESVSIEVKNRTRQLLGYVERTFGYLFDDKQFGWQGVLQILPKFVEALPKALRILLPQTAGETEPQKHFLPMFRTLSLDFRARVTAGSVRNGEMTDRALGAWVVDVLNNSEEKKVLLELLKTELPSPNPAQQSRLDEIASRPVIRRTQISSTSFISKGATREAKALVPAVLIEPDESLRYAFKTRLGMEGFGVIEAANGADAGGIIDEAQPRLVVMELVLSGVTGLGLLSKLRSKKPVVPVVAKSNDERLSIEFDVKTYPAIAYVKKPATADGIVDAVKSLRAKHQF
jgi:CheY-like chemotaxis protein